LSNGIFPFDRWSDGPEIGRLNFVVTQFYDPHFPLAAQFLDAIQSGVDVSVAFERSDNR